MKWLTGPVGVVLLLGVADAPRACAQDVDVKAILERLERVEQHNRALQQSLDQLQQRPAGEAVPSSPDPGSAPGPSHPAGPGDDEVEAIRDAVDDYLQDQADRKAEAEAKQQKEAEERGYEIGSNLSMKAFWRDGFQVETPGKDFRVHIGGRLQADGAWFAPDHNLQQAINDPTRQPWQDGADFRRIRFRTDGTFWEVFDFVLEMEFSQGIQGTTRHPFPTDVYVDFKALPWLGFVAVGHYKEPFSLQDYGTPDSYGVFMERGADDAFSPDRNIGVMWHNAYFNDTVAVASGIFRSNSDKFSGNAFDYGDGEYAYTSRVVWMPYYANDGRCWLLVGPAYRRGQLDPDDVGLGPDGVGAGTARFQIRPPIRVNSPTLADTGELRADHFDLYNAQLGLNLGSFLFETEYYHAHVHNIRRGLIAPGVPRLVGADFRGFYVSASYFLTGEYHGLDRKMGRKTRVRPNEQWFLVKRGDRGCHRGFCHGLGAWEVAARYSWVDLHSPALGAFPGTPGVPDSGVEAVKTAGIEQDITLSLSCYLNPQLRIQANYAHCFRKVANPAESGQLDVFGMRLWFDF